MRLRPLPAVGALAVLAALGTAAGCTSSSPPHRDSSSATSVTVSSAPPVSSALPSGTASSSGGSSTASAPAPSPTRTAPGVPACAPPSVTVAGAPFCFTLPKGFRNYSSLKDYGKGWTYRTLVSVGQHDLIEVFASGGADTDRLGEAALKALYQRVFLVRVGTLGIAQAEPARRTSVDGARAYRQVARYKNGVATDIVTVYRGRSVLSVQCQSAQQKATVAAGCASVLSSLDFVRR